METKTKGKLEKTKKNLQKIIPVRETVNNPEKEVKRILKKNKALSKTNRRFLGLNGARDYESIINCVLAFKQNHSPRKPINEKTISDNLIKISQSSNAFSSFT